MTALVVLMWTRYDELYWVQGTIRGTIQGPGKQCAVQLRGATENHRGLGLPERTGLSMMQMGGSTSIPFSSSSIMGGMVDMRVMVGIIAGQSSFAAGHHGAPSSSTCTCSRSSEQRCGQHVQVLGCCRLLARWCI